MSDELHPSQTIRAILGLRSLIVQGALRAGERVYEQALVERLGVSRTPVRSAMARVCEEGLLDALPQGGFAVARFSEGDVSDAIAIRGTLEGMGARMAAERGVPARILSEMHRHIDRLDQVVDNLKVDPDLTEYVRLNDRVHELILDAAQSAMLRRSLSRSTALPFAAPNAFVSASNATTPTVRKILIVAQEQHRSILEAIERREGTRAQALTIEHARSAWKYLRGVFLDEGAQANFPGMNLVDSLGMGGTPAHGNQRSNPSPTGLNARSSD